MRTEEEIFQGMSKTDFFLRAKYDPKFWCERMLGLWIKPFHEEWINYFLNNDRVCLIAPTGCGKTRVMAIGMSTWIAWFNQLKRILIVSHTKEQAQGILDDMKTVFYENEVLKEIIPNKYKDTWSKSELNTTTKCKIFCKPFTENIRSYHADFLFADEISQYRDHSMFFRYVLTRVNAKHGKFVGFTTPRSEVDLAHKLLEKDACGIVRTGFVGNTYRILDKKGNSTFPEVYTKERLDEIKAGMSDIEFAREYLCDVTVVDDALYPPYMVLDCFNNKIGFEVNTGEHVFIGVDFAVSTGKTADYSVFTVVENVGKHTYIRSIERYKGAAIDWQKQRIAELCRIYNPRFVFIDKSNVGESFLQEFMQMNLPVVGCDFYHTHRNDYLINLRRFIEGKRDKEGNLKEPPRLIIPRNLDDPECVKITDELFKELTSFVKTETGTGLVTYKSQAKHDDCVLSLALAVKNASEQQVFDDSIVDMW